jgi:hypothetical protein
VGFGDPGGVIIDGGRNATQLDVRNSRAADNLVENIAIVNGGSVFNPAIRITNSELVLRDVRVSSTLTTNGWGVLVAADSTVEMYGMQVTDCRCGGTVGLFLFQNSTILIDSAHIWDNRVGDAESRFGAIWNTTSSLTIRNTSFANNWGHAVYQSSDGSELEVSHSSFVGQTGSGLNLGESNLATVTNSVFAHNSEYGIQETDVGGDIGSLESSLFHDNDAGDYFDLDRDRARNGPAEIDGLANVNNTLGGDPLFISVPASNLRLREGSACVDVGDPDFTLPVDQDGRARPRGPLPDVGAFESFLEP